MKNHLFKVVGCKKEPEAKVTFSNEPYVVSDYLFGYSNDGTLEIVRASVQIRDDDKIDIKVLVNIEMESCDFVDTVELELVDPNGNVIDSSSIYLKVEEHEWGYYDNQEISFYLVPDAI